MHDFASPGPVKHLALKVWMCVFLYAVLSGLAVQLLVLPYGFPQLHAGNGLLAGRDWVGFHEQAVVQAQKISLLGWDSFLLRPDGDNAITGVTSFLYVVFGPRPFVLLPLSAAMFATGGVALFSMLRRLNLGEGEAVFAMLPYLLFPSALLQYGQIHKDAFCTSGVLIVLWSWVSLLEAERKVRQVFPLLAISGLALLEIAVFRPYFMYPFLGLGTLLLLWYIGSLVLQTVRPQSARAQIGAQSGRAFTFQSIVILGALCVMVYGLSISYLDIRFRSFPADNAKSAFSIPVFILQSNKDVRSADAVRIYAEGAPIDATAQIRAVEECRPVIVLRDDAFFENLVNRVFLKIAVARAGFTSSGGTTAGSNIDKGVDFCKNADLIRYVPRALQIAFFAPFPSKWFSIEKRNSSAMEIYISAVEMLYCYVAYFGLLYWLVSYRRWNLALVVPLTFAFGLMLLLGLTVANVGTLYRMRFPFVMIFVGIGMGGLLRIAGGRLRSRVGVAPARPHE